MGTGQTAGAVALVKFTGVRRPIQQDLAAKTSQVGLPFPRRWEQAEPVRLVEYS